MYKWAMLVLLIGAAPTFAGTFVVNDIGDASDTAPGDGVCDIPVGGPPRCTLRAAIEEANALSGLDHIEFSVGLFTLSLATPLPTITERLIIDATTVPGYNDSATSVLDAPPLIRLDGSGLGGTTADGIRINAGSFVDIKGLAIYGFPDNGIEVINTDTIVLDANWIGVRSDGSASGNGGSGIYMSGSERCVVGQEIPLVPDPSVEGVGNLVSNNGEDGIYVQLGDDNLIAGNHIGVNPGGGSGFGNARHGIQLVGPNNRIGQFRGLADGALTAPNIIEHNGLDGIRVLTGNQLIYSNQIFSNGAAGIGLNGGSSKVGYVAEGMRNFIAANGTHGIHVGNVLDASDSNIIRYNWIYQNQQRGIQLSAGNGNQIRDNEIFDNDGDAIRLDDAGNLLEFNEIGFLNGALVGNAANGIVLAAGGNTLDRNRIGGMADDGIDVVSGVTSTIIGNSVGAAGDGSLFGNAGAGIRVRAAAVDTQIVENFIGDNADGILLEGATNDVCGNWIGVGSSNEDIGNAVEGMRVLGGANTIGDEDAGCAANLIGFNASDGIQVHGDNNTIRDNRLGGQPGLDLGNGRGGILLTDGASINDVSGNIIWNNDDGIRVGVTAGTGNRLEDNNYGGNADVAIDLNDDGDSPNDAGDVDSGPNNMQNYPVITNIDDSGPGLTLTYHVDSDAGQASYPLQVDFYINNFNRRDGYRVHSDSYNVAPGASRTITFSPPVDAAFILAMTIDADGNSSELGVQHSYSIAPPPDELFSDRFEIP